MTEVLIVPTGTANTASVLAAFTRLGARPKLCDDASAIERAARIVLPGVGAFAAAAAEIDRLGMREPLRERILAGRATLAICLGMQLFCTTSEEDSDAHGLGVIDAAVRAFPAGLRVPQLGWNRVTPVAGSELLREGYAYFANSYRIEQIPVGWAGATTDYGGTFASALERGNTLACQFHPEISGSYGEAVLRRWLERSEREIAC